MPNRKLSRREAIKLLGVATGATVLANLPSKWSTPELAQGVLPAHAQTSSLGLLIESCNFTLDIITGAWSSAPFVVPVANIPPIPPATGMRFTITFVNTHFEFGTDPQSPNPYVNSWVLDPATGTIIHINNSNGALVTAGRMLPNAMALSGSVTILWEFADPSFGSGSCSRTAEWVIAG